MFALVALLIAAAPHPKVAEGMKHFDAADYAKARDALVPVVDQPTLPDPDREKARMFLAASYQALGDAASARAQLLQLARQFPQTRMDPGIFVPELVVLADDARAEVAREPKLPPQGVCPKLECPKGEETVCAPLPERPGFGYGLVPFGVGQFMNRQPAKGLLFLGTELAAFGTAAVTFGIFEGLKIDGAFGTSGRFREPERAGQLQTVYLSAFYVGLGFVVWGVIDAIVSRPDEPAATTAVFSVAPGAVRVRF